MRIATAARPGLSAFLATALLLAGSAAAQLQQSAAPGALVHLRVTRPAQAQVIPATVFGSFLEPIGHSTYGGLWADVVTNPSFEDGLWSVENVDRLVREDPELRRSSSLGLPLPWKPLDQTQGARYLPVRGDAANSAESILVMSLPGKEVGIRQSVYLPVQRELSYHGSLWLKHVRGGTAVTVSLRRHAHPEQTLSSATLEAPSTTWTKLTFALTLKPGDLQPLEPVDLVIAVSDDARVQVDNVSLLPADAIDGMDPDEIRMARDLHSPLVRFGGNFTSAYDWHDGIGPLDKRVSKLNVSWGIPEYNTFGTGEFLRFCELIGAQPQIALNLGTGSPEENAAWVTWVNQHFGDHRGGLLWELGNELWGDFQEGYPSQERVAALTLANSQAVRRADPRSRLIATGADEDHFREWNAVQLTNPAGTFNYLSTHFVVTDNVVLQRPPEDFRTMAALALPVGLARQLEAIHQQIAASPNGAAVKTAFTEWLMVSNTRTAPNFTNLGGALFTAGFLDTIFTNSGVVPISDMTGIMEFGGIWKRRGQVFGTPAYWVLREYATAHPHELMHVTSDGPTYSISQGIQRLPEIKDVPFLEVVAATSEDRRHLVLFCLNRSLTQSTTAQIDLSALGLTTGASARVATITGDSILVENDEETPDLVKPAVHQEPVSGTVQHRFPNASVTVIDIPLQ